MGLAFFVLFIVLCTEAILWVGYSEISRLAYVVYLTYFKTEAVEKQRRIKRDILNIKHELARTSSQDQFAKWAKLRRKLDSKMSDLDKSTKALGFMKTSFEMKFTTFLWVATNGIQLLIMVWYRRSAVFYLPPDWFSPVTWIFALPLAPAGSVSVPIWFIICRKISRKLITTCKELRQLYMKYTPEPVKEQAKLLTTIVMDWMISKIQAIVARMTTQIPAKAKETSSASEKEVSSSSLASSRMQTDSEAKPPPVLGTE